MSTRYLWDVYDVKYSQQEQHQRVNEYELYFGSNLTYIAAIGSSYTYDPENKYSVPDPTWIAGSDSGSFQRNATDNPCLVPKNSDIQLSTATNGVMFYNEFQGEYQPPLYWDYKYGTGSSGLHTGTVKLLSSDKNSARDFSFCNTKQVSSQGSTQKGQASSGSKSYPDNGAGTTTQTASNWYVFKGTDSIDPLSVTYSSNELERGKPVTVIVEPRPREEETVSPEWKASTLPQADYWYDAAYGGGKFVAVGRENAAYSADGASWSSSSSAASKNLMHIAYGGGKFVAVGLSGQAAYTTDGISWTAVTLPQNMQCGGIAYGAGKFVAIENKSGSNLAAYSADGVSWTVTTLSTSSGTGSWQGICYGGGKFVVVGTNGRVSYSTDGVAWTSASPLPTSSAWRCVAYGNGIFVATSSTGEAVRSADGVDWSSAVATPAAVDLLSIAYGDGKFIAAGYAGSAGGAVQSADGATWEALTLPASANWNSVAYGGETFVVTAFDSTTTVYLDTNPQVETWYTVSYLYQYSTDGGLTWLTAGSATTDTQKEIIVPENAEQFKARVKAQDDIGFTSADYVSGNNVEVQTMRLWAGIGGEAREGCKLWVGVNGAARPAARGWVGDENGKARRWF